MKEKMRVILITLCLLIAVTINAEEAGTSNTNNLAKEVDISKVIDPRIEASMGKVITKPSKEDGNILGNVISPRSVDPAKEADIGETINSLLFDYESTKFKRYSQCSSKVVDACNSRTTLHDQNGVINNKNELGLCLFESMEKCLLDHVEVEPPKLKTIPFTFKDNQYEYQYHPPLPRPCPQPISPGVLLPLPCSPPRPIPQPRIPPMATQYQSTLIETLKFKTVLKTCSHVSAQTCYNDPNVTKSVLASCLIPSLSQCLYLATTPGN